MYLLKEIKDLIQYSLGPTRDVKTPKLQEALNLLNKTIESQPSLNDFYKWYEKNEESDYLWDGEDETRITIPPSKEDIYKFFMRVDNYEK